MKEYWNNLFKNRDKEFSHEPYLDDDIKLFKPKKLLDIGSGDGRNTFFFINNNFEVTCLDYSEIGIKKIQDKALSKGLHINVHVADIFNDNLDQLTDSFDTIAMIHFFPDIVTLEKVFNLLKPNCILYCITFINDGYEKNSSRYEIGISKKEITEINLKYNIIKDDYRTDPRGDFYCFYAQSGVST